MNPLDLIKRAIAAVPAVKYALGVAGVAAVVAIVLGLKLPPQVAVFGTLIVVGLMFVLLIFASAAAEDRNTSLRMPATVLVWFYTLVIMTVTTLFISSYFAGWPSRQVHASSHDTGPGGSKVTDEIIRNSNKAGDSKPVLIAASSDLPSGSTTLYNGMGHYGQSTFIFSKGEVSDWGSKSADIGVSNPDTTQPAQFFAMNNQAPYTDPKAEVQDMANAGIIDMGTKDFDSVKKAPSTGYTGTYFKPELGHVYCVRTRDGKHYAKIVVTDLEGDRIAFDYVYQPNGSQSF